MKSALSRWSVRHADWVDWAYARFEKFAPRLGRVINWLPRDGVSRAVIVVERAVKGALFDCKMCGQCGLSITGMACPNGCAKQMRNGPCGGVRMNGNCEVVPDQPCTWVGAGRGDAQIAQANGHLHTSTWNLRALPGDHRRWGESTWVPMMFKGLTPATLDERGAPSTRPASVDGPPPAVKSASAFEVLCTNRRKFIVTVELSPPDSIDSTELLNRAEKFRGLADAINITDGAGANCHMSSAAASALLIRAGHHTIAQFSCRDRNRIALQGDVLGAAALGIENVLCLTGDDVSQGDMPQAKPVFDLDSVNMLHTFATMRDRGTFSSGRRLAAAPRLFLGASANPFVPPYHERVDNLERKIDAGARFIQTQFCFDVPLFERFMEVVRSRSLHRRAAIIVGVGILSNAKALRRMADRVPGINVPVSVTDRISASSDEREEGIRIVVEMIALLRQIEGVAGVHLMGYRNEDTLVEIVKRSGLSPSHQSHSLHAGVAP